MRYNLIIQILFNQIFLELVHQYKSFNFGYKDTALWGIYFVCDPLKCDQFNYTFAQEWMRTCNILSESEATRAKNVIKANILRKLDGKYSKIQ